MKEELAIVMEAIKIPLQGRPYFTGGRYNSGSWEWVDSLDASRTVDLLCDSNPPFDNNILILSETGVSGQCLVREGSTRRKSLCVTKWQPRP